MVSRLLAPAAALLPLFLSAAAAVPAAGAVPPSQALPRLKVVQPEVDLGSHFGGPAFWFTFRLRNEGTAPLKIRDVKLSCGCLAAFYDRTIPPARETRLRVKMATAGVEGAVAKPIQLLTNDPHSPAIDLVARVNLRSPIQVTSGRVLQLDIKPGEDAVSEITLTSHEANPLEIRRVETSIPALQVKMLSPGKEPSIRKLAVRLASAEASETFTGNLTVHTNSRLLPSLQVQVTGFPEGFVHVVPRRLYFSQLTETVPVPVKRVLILMRDEGPFTVTEARSDHPALSLEVQNREKEPYAQVIVQYHGGWKPGKVEGKLTLRLSGGGARAIQVPYVAEVATGAAPEAPAEAVASAQASAGADALPKAP